MQKFDSESVVAAGYEARTRTLRLKYTGGQIYDYRNVPVTVFNDFLDAPSKGQFVNWQVKPYYPYRRVSGGRVRRR